MKLKTSIMMVLIAVLSVFSATNNTYLKTLAAMQSPSFELAVKMGMVEGYSSIDKFGVAPSGDTETDVWEYGGIYQYDQFGTAPIAYASSDNALDVGNTILIIGLDINGDEIEQTILTNGQTPVVLQTPLWRVYRAQNISDEGLDLVGILYIGIESNPPSGVPPAASVRAIINDGNNQTLMSLYTIPKGKVGFLYRGEVGVELDGGVSSLAEYAHLHYESRRLGKIFTVKKAITCVVGGSATYQDKRSFPDVIPSLTDVKITATSRTQVMGLFGTFDILLVDEDKFSEQFLISIGQPGY